MRTVDWALHWHGYLSILSSTTTKRQWRLKSAIISR